MTKWQIGVHNVNMALQLTAPVGAPEAMTRMLPALPVVYQGLEIGVASANDYMAASGLPFDGSWHAAMVRIHLRQHIHRQGWTIDSDDCLKAVELNNGGLSIRYAGCQLRILKAYQKQVPPPGRNGARQRFYRQVSLLPESEDGHIANLILLWVLDADHQLSQVLLACPRYEDPWIASAYWYLQVPHAAEMIRPIAANPAPSVDEMDEDLDMETKDRAERREMEDWKGDAK